MNTKLPLICLLNTSVTPDKLKLAILACYVDYNVTINNLIFMRKLVDNYK